jgi:hypothetical protein
VSKIPAKEDQLAGAIAAVLRRPTHVSPEAALHDLVEDGRDAWEVIQLVMATISDLVSGVHDERKFLALQLVRSSCEHGRAGCFLLASNPGDMAGVALSVHRSQIEQFLRAVFVARIADEEQLADFMDADQGPRQRTAKEKWAKIKLEDLADLVDPALAEIAQMPGDGKIARMVKNTWEPLCGLVHGGRALRALYEDRHGQVGCAVPAEVQFQMTVNAVATVNHCLILTTSLSDLEPGRQDAILQTPMDAFYQYVDRRNKRLRKVGMLGDVVELAPRPR